MPLRRQLLAHVVLDGKYRGEFPTSRHLRAEELAFPPTFELLTPASPTASATVVREGTLDYPDNSARVAELADALDLGDDREIRQIPCFIGFFALSHPPAWRRARESTRAALRRLDAVRRVSTECASPRC